MRLPEYESQIDIFSNIKIGEMVFLGEEFDDICTEDEAIESMFKFLDLKIRQEGCNFYIYSLQSVRATRAINWYPICLPSVYIRENNQYAPPSKNSNDNPREVLTNTTTGEQILGNDLEMELSSDVETTYDVNGNEIFVNYYYVILPSGEKRKMERYEIAQTIDKDVLMIDGVYKVMTQKSDGTYDWETMPQVDKEQVNVYYTPTTEFTDSYDDDSVENEIEG